MYGIGGRTSGSHAALHFRTLFFHGKGGGGIHQLHTAFGKGKTIKDVVAIQFNDDVNKRISDTKDFSHESGI
jgi:hypothetical protein